MIDFRNRLQKNYKHLSKWARKQNISCYRVYDWDIPGHPLVIDFYGEYVHISEYKTRHSLADEEYDNWWHLCLNHCKEILGVEEEKLFIKKRQRHDHKQSQYEKFSDTSFVTWQKENDMYFKINLTDYLDTGLFLDHRPLRMKVKEIAAGKRVLNLFSYTGSFSVNAAAGGAKKVTTVDLSNTYINWCKENFQKNELPMELHDFIVSDVMEFLKKDNGVYDLVITDPPSFSNSKKMKGTWDTQRDHAAMLSYIYDRLASGGIVYFSNNFRSFVPEFDHLKYSKKTDISLKTIPEDFRNKQIHKCYELIK